MNNDTVIGRTECRACGDNPETRLSDLDKEYQDRLTHYLPVRYEEREQQHKALIAELEAARIAYANEFPMDEHGLPDVGAIHGNIRQLKRRQGELEAQLAKAEAALEAADGLENKVYELLRGSDMIGLETLWRAYRQARAAMCLNGGDT